MTAGALASWEGHDTSDLARTWDVPLVEAWDSIGSTNDRLGRLAREGAGDWSVVVAAEQTRGRGRRGATWQSAPGAGLWMSVLLPAPEAELPLPLIVGAASAVAIESLLPGVVVSVKWPNDLLVRSGKLGGAGQVGELGKLGGILCEECEGRVVAGIGINLRAPDNGFDGAVAHTAMSLEMVSSKLLTQKKLAQVIVDRIRAFLGATDPWEHAAAVLASRDALIGRRVDTESKGAGVAVGIDEAGALVVERDDGTRVRVVSGSVRLVDR